MISVIICTHNPRRDFLSRTINSLKNQTIEGEEWNVTIVDNASDEDVRELIQWGDLQGSVVREEQPGLSHARMRGIRETNGDLIVFVDDDNVLRSDYLDVALKISKEYPFIGAWGGALEADYEIKPPEWSEPFLRRLAIYDVPQDVWGKLPYHYEILPAGAGMCVRRDVAREYVRQASGHDAAESLDRNGSQLGGHGDRHIAYCAYDLNYGTGRFSDLRLTHIIDKGRLTLDYFVRQAEDNAYSGVMFKAMKGVSLPSRTQTSILHTLRRYISYWRRGLTKEQRMIYEADIRGKKRALDKVSRED
jgi:glycosyltransferase involved in cell wall biosynthesis